MVAESVETATGKNNNLHNIPEGHWRDGLCDCFVYGCCHPLCCLAFWFKPLALGQVMTRLNLSSSSCNPAPREKSTSWSPFTIMVVIVILYIVINPFILIILNITTGNDSTFISMLQLVLRIAFGLFILLSTCKTRAYIRRKYNIPETSCDGCEDCCCAFWCGCCTVTQMARHTADYNTYHAFCCSETGLNDSAPHIV